MVKTVKEIVISKDKAVFWLDETGCWNNVHGKFQHKKIIDYFHASIKKDEHGYFLCQIRENFKEKVYFPYEDCALFVFDVIIDQDITLVLNTKKKIKLKPRRLFIEADALYQSEGDERVKFTDRGLLKISELIEFRNDGHFINVKNRKYKIREL